MPGNSYMPEYEKIYRFSQGYFFNSLDEVKIPLEELEVFCEIKAKNIQIHKYLPLEIVLGLKEDKEGILESVWCDYFLDMECHGNIGIHSYNDHPELKRYKQFHSLKSIFIKWKEINYTQYKSTDGSNPFADYGIVNIYMRVRRVKIKNAQTL